MTCCLCIFQHLCGGMGYIHGWPNMVLANMHFIMIGIFDMIPVGLLLYLLWNLSDGGEYQREVTFFFGFASGQRFWDPGVGFGAFGGVHF